MAFAHLLTVHLPEEAVPLESDARGGFDLIGSWRAAAAVSGLFALILFSVFNNFIGGVYLALMDPYGLELISVESWGALFALGASGYIVGGAVIGKAGLGRNPLRTMLLVVIAMGVLGIVFTIRERGWQYVTCIWLCMALYPAVGALALLSPVYRRISAEYAQASD